MLVAPGLVGPGLVASGIEELSVVGNHAMGNKRTSGLSFALSAFYALYSLSEGGGC